jgi:hypothetical protein
LRADFLTVARFRLADFAVFFAARFPLLLAEPRFFAAPPEEDLRPLRDGEGPSPVR